MSRFYAGAIVVIPIITGIISFVSSSLMVFMISRVKNFRSQVKQRLLLGLCCADLVFSVACASSTFPGPDTEASSRLTQRGNQRTCDLQAFLYHVGIAVPSYNACLCLYYYLAIGHGRTDRELLRCIEPSMHLVVWTVALTTAILPLTMELYNFDGALGCFVSSPPSCQDSPASCHRGVRWGDPTNYSFIFSLTPLAIDFAIITICMTLIYGKVRRTEGTKLRWRFEVTTHAERTSTISPNHYNNNNNNNNNRRKSYWKHHPEPQQQQQQQRAASPADKDAKQQEEEELSHNTNHADDDIEATAESWNNEIDNSDSTKIGKRGEKNDRQLSSVSFAVLNDIAGEPASSDAYRDFSKDEEEEEEDDDDDDDGEDQKAPPSKRPSVWMAMTSPVQRKTSKLSRRSTKGSRTIRETGFLYVISFLITYIPAILTIVVPNGAGFWRILTVVLLPLQGFWNFLIYVRPRYLQMRQKRPDLNPPYTLLQAILQHDT